MICKHLWLADYHVLERNYLFSHIIVRDITKTVNWGGGCTSCSWGRGLKNYKPISIRWIWPLSHWLYFAAEILKKNGTLSLMHLWTSNGTLSLMHWWTSNGTLSLMHWWTSVFGLIVAYRASFNQFHQVYFWYLQKSIKINESHNFVSTQTCRTRSHG